MCKDSRISKTVGVGKRHELLTKTAEAAASK